MRGTLKVGGKCKSRLNLNRNLYSFNGRTSVPLVQQKFAQIMFQGVSKVQLSLQINTSEGGTFASEGGICASEGGVCALEEGTCASV